MGMTTADWMAGAGSGGTGGGGGGTTTGPTVTAPHASFVTGTSGKANVTLKLKWDASSTDNVTYQLQYSQDSGTWTPVTLGSPTDLTANVSVAPGHYYRFRLRATDSSNNVGDWATTANRKLARSQETAAALSYTGTWSSAVYLAGASKSYVKKVSAAGNNVSLTFTGTYVGFVSTVGTNRGKVEVWLDGSKVDTVDLYASTTRAGRVVWSMDVTAATHTVEVRALGTKNASSTGARVDVDAFLTWK
jgi:hypothetical protein